MRTPGSPAQPRPTSQLFGEFHPAPRARLPELDAATKPVVVVRTGNEAITQECAFRRDSIAAVEAQDELRVRALLGEVCEQPVDAGPDLVDDRRDVLDLGVTGAAILVYAIQGGDDFTDRATLPNQMDVILGATFIVLLLEATRRRKGESKWSRFVPVFRLLRPKNDPLAIEPGPAGVRGQSVDPLLEKKASANRYTPKTTFSQMQPVTMMV